MDIDEFERQVLAELGEYEKYYTHYNETLEKTLGLIGRLRKRLAGQGASGE